MNKFYVLCAAFATVCGAYFCGTIVGKEKCRTQMAQKNVEQMQNQYIQNVKQERIINEKVYTTGAGDVRRVLRDKYTIGE